MKELSAIYPHNGYRRIRAFLRRQGFELSCSRTHRQWRQAGLLVPKKRPRKRIASARPRIHTPFKANRVWAYDFVFDTAASGRQIQCLVVVDEYTRECLTSTWPGHPFQARDRGAVAAGQPARGPAVHALGQRPEFVSQAILE